MPPRSDHLPPNAKSVFQGKIFTVWQWEQKLFDGTTSIFESITRPDAAYVLPVLDNNSLLLIKDEQPNRKAVLTMPRGRIESNEEPEAAAKRELLEETGHEVRELIPWYTWQPWGKISWTIYFFIGRGAHKTSEPKLEGGERIILKPTPLEDFVELAVQGTLQEQQIQIMMLQAKLDPTKMEVFKTLLYGSAKS